MHDLAAWLEWKERCALGLCDEANQWILRRFAETRFHGFLRRFAFQTNLRETDLPAVTGRDAWHLLETHLTVPGASSGKRYKDWLFARTAGSSDAPLDVIQGGATLLIRDVVREFLRAEHSPANMLSVDQPCGEGTGAVTLEDLLPGGVDPADEAQRREFDDLARRHAAAFLQETNRRERVALLAKQLGVSLAHPVVQEAAGCAKSMVNQAYRDVVVRIGSRLRADYPDDDREAVLMLATMTLTELQRSVALSEKSENLCAGLFLLAEQKDAPLVTSPAQVNPGRERREP